MTAADPARQSEHERTVSRLLTRFRDFIDRTFAYREILLRSSDRVSYIRLTPQVQKTAALLLAIGITWGAYASVGYLDQRDLLDLREQEIARSQDAYAELLAEVDRYQRHFASITRELEATQGRLLAQLETEGIAEAPGERVERDQQAADLRARMVVARDELRGQLQALELDLKDVARRNGSLKDRIHSLQAALTATENERTEVREAHHRLGRTLSETEAALARERSKRTELASQLLDLRTQIDDWKSRYAALSDARDALAEERDLLDGALTSERATTAALEQQVDGLQDALAEAEDGMKRAVAARDELTSTAKSLRGDLKQARTERDKLEAKLAREGEAVARARAEISALQQRRDELEAGSQRLARALRDGKSENGALADRATELEQALAVADERIENLQSERDEHLREIAQLSANLKGSREKVAGLQGQLYGMTRTLDEADQRASALGEQRDLLSLRLTEARTQLADQAERHDAVIQHLSDRTRQSIDTMEELLALTGLDIEAVLDEAATKVEGDGKGGPFLPYEDVPAEPHADRPNETLGALDDRIRRWEALQLVLAATPLTAPLDEEFRISSPFGKRKDPLNGRLARHEGLDLVAAYRTPVRASAPGVVAFAGWKSGYGRVIEIDHGFGIRTLFAHLRRIDVEVGERITFRQQIGQLGSSGRSTGAHLHYEVRFNGTPLDPLKFMKAASHVLKG